MSKKKQSTGKGSSTEGKKVVTTTKRKVVTKSSKSQATLSPTKSKLGTRSSKSKKPSELVFGKRNYIFMAAGIALIILGMILMSGGRQVSPDSFDAEAIYSFRRITLAPILILGGFIVEIYAVFSRK